MSLLKELLNALRPLIHLIFFFLDDFAFFLHLYLHLFSLDLLPLRALNRLTGPLPLVKLLQQCRGLPIDLRPSSRRRLLCKHVLLGCIQLEAVRADKARVVQRGERVGPQGQ